MNNTIKVHFSSAKKACAASPDKTARAGVRTKSGRVKTWIAHVEKAHPYEKADEAAKRFSQGK